MISFRGKTGNPKDFIAREYLSKVRPSSKANNSSKVKRVFNHFTCATDTNQIKHIFNDVVHNIVEKSIVDSGLQ